MTGRLTVLDCNCEFVHEICRDPRGHHLLVDPSAQRLDARKIALGLEIRHIVSVAKIVDLLEGFDCLRVIHANRTFAFIAFAVGCYASNEAILNRMDHPLMQHVDL